MSDSNRVYARHWREFFSPEHFGFEPFDFGRKIEKLNAERLKTEGVMGGGLEASL